MSETEKLPLEQRLPGDVVEQLERYLVEAEADERSLNTAQIMEFFETLSEDYQKPFIEEAAWSPLNDKRMFDNQAREPQRLSVEEMLTKGYVEQTIEVLPGVRVTFRSARMFDNSFLESWRHIEGDKYDKLDGKGYGETSGIKAEDLLTLMDASPAITTLNELAMSITKLNGQHLGDVPDVYRHVEGQLPQPQLALAVQRRNVLAMMDVRLIQVLLLNLRAFQKRVLQLYTPEGVQAF